VITFFSTPKPFAGHIDAIPAQRAPQLAARPPGCGNHPFRDDAGAAEVCRELGIRHVPQVRRNPHARSILPAFMTRRKNLPGTKFFAM